jgi:hypothetical protein
MLGPTPMSVNRPPDHLAHRLLAVDPFRGYLLRLDPQNRAA